MMGMDMQQFRQRHPEVSRETPTQAAARQWWQDHPEAENPLEALHGGWPFGPGPDQWRWMVEYQRATDIQPAGLHVCCTECGQSIMRLGNWSITWNKPSEWRGADTPADGALKPLVAAHVMQVHSEHVTS